MTVRLAASGKVFLAGEYAVLDPGRPALVAGIDWKMHAVAEPGARGVQIVHRPSGLLWDGGQAPAELRFAARAALLAMAFCRKPDGVRISFEDDLSREGRKLGLGGSAAACVLAVRAVCALADRRSGEDEILALAVAAHWAEQGGAGSGADVAAAALGGILEVRSRIVWQSAEEVMALPGERVAASRPLDVRRLAIPPELRLLLVDTGAPANTRSLVREVRAFARGAPARWRQLADIYVAQQLACYPPDYLAAQPSPERILETVERFEEDLTDIARIHRPLHLVMQVGEALKVSPARDKSGSEDPLMQQLEERLREMIATLNTEPRRSRARST